MEFFQYLFKTLSINEFLTLFEQRLIFSKSNGLLEALRISPACTAVYKISVFTSKKNIFLILNKEQIMFFCRNYNIYFENYTKHLTALSRQHTEFFYVAACDKYNYH